jgi:hypothetical protein
MDVKQTAEKLHALTKKQTAEIISTLEGWGYKDISVGLSTYAHGKNKRVAEFPSDKIVHLSIDASFYEEDD